MKNTDLALDFLQIVDFCRREFDSTANHLINVCVDFICKIVFKRLENMKHFLQLSYILGIILHSNLSYSMLMLFMERTGAIRANISRIDECFAVTLPGKPFDIVGRLDKGSICGQLLRNIFNLITLGKTFAYRPGFGVTTLSFTKASNESRQKSISCAFRTAMTSGARRLRRIRRRRR